MKTSIVLKQLLTVTVILGLTSLLFAQNKVKNIEFDPELGQEGKDVRWFPTPNSLVEKMLDIAKITPNDVLVDLGSGDGRIVIAAAKRGIHAIGVEYNPEMVELSIKNAEKEHVGEKVEFVQKDLFEYDFSKATIVTLFLLPEINLRLRPKLLNLKPGTRIITTTFTMQDWPYDAIEKVTDNTSSWTTGYMWIVPAKVEGKWKFTGGELNLKQKFQKVEGDIKEGINTYKISGGKLIGKELTFTADSKLYKCIVEGDLISGTIKQNDNITAWKGRRENN